MAPYVFSYLLPFCKLSLVSIKKFAISIEAFVRVSLSIVFEHFCLSLVMKTKQIEYVLVLPYYQFQKKIRLLIRFLCKYEILHVNVNTALLYACFLFDCLFACRLVWGWFTTAAKAEENKNKIKIWLNSPVLFQLRGTVVFTNKRWKSWTLIHCNDTSYESNHIDMVDN